MNFRDIQRAVRAQRIERTLGEAPSLGHLARMPGTGLPRGARKKRRRGEGGRGTRAQNNRKRMILLWTVVLVVAALGVLGTALWFWLAQRLDSSSENVRESLATRGINERVTSRFESPPREVAEALVKQALLIRDSSKVAEYFRLGSTSPEAVVAFLRKMESVDGPITGYVWLRSLDVNGMLIDGVAVNTQFEGVTRNRLALMTPTAEGKWQIDFDAFARTVKPAWQDLMAMTTGQGLVRILFAKDSYYNRAFSDETRWICYRMGSSDLATDLFGYCRKDSPQAAAMEGILDHKRLSSGHGTLCRATLMVQRLEGAETRQFEITRVLAEDWVLSDIPLDGERE